LVDRLTLLLADLTFRPSEPQTRGALAADRPASTTAKLQNVSVTEERLNFKPHILRELEPET